MRFTSADKAANDRRVAADVERHGCHVVSVFDPDDREPTFSYSIGIGRSAGAPEAIVIGLKPSLGHSMINGYCRRVRAGEVFERGRLYEGFLEDFPNYIEPVRLRRHEPCTLGCTRFYGDEPYAVVQLVWPSTRGVWPWQKAASDWLRHHQPMLGRVRPDRP